ncbi:MAG: MinD/ParA family protein [Thermodesulfobacteriota bacterium]|nr:MinD/ParA family protein [Thermodesulfobacteriota bacterium]
MTQIITVTSGKGGTGKTSISLNLSLQLAALGFKTALFDADLGLANINVLTGIYPDRDLASVITGKHTLDEIIIKNYQGIDIIPGSSGVEKLSDLSQTQADLLVRSFVSLDQYDFFLFDTSAGISSQVISFCMAASYIILAVTTEPTSLTDAYALIKVLSKKGYKSDINIIINQAETKKAAESAYGQLKDTVCKFLPVRTAPLGIIAKDRHVAMSVVTQTPLTLLFPDAPAAVSIKKISRKIASHAGRNTFLPLEIFWEQCIGYLSESEQEKKGADKKETMENAYSSSLPPNTGSRINTILSDLEKRAVQMSKDIQALKKYLNGLDSQGKAASRPEVTLDFEAWLEKSGLTGSSGFYGKTD